MYRCVHERVNREVVVKWKGGGERADDRVSLWMMHHLCSRTSKMPSRTTGGGGGVSPLVLLSKMGVVGMGVIGLAWMLLGVAGVMGRGSNIPRPIPSTPDAERSASRAMSMVDG